MKRLEIDVTTGECQTIALTSEEITEAQALAQQAAQAEAQWKVANAVQLRHTDYVAEADPLFFKAQRGEATLAEWQAKVAEIKARYPKE
jgi:hypothetical protein